MLRADLIPPFASMHCMASVDCDALETAVGLLAEAGIAALRFSMAEYREAEGANDWGQWPAPTQSARSECLLRAPTTQAREAILRKLKSRPY